jgi:hypothetical protein
LNRRCTCGRGRAAGGGVGGRAGIDRDILAGVVFRISLYYENKKSLAEWANRYRLLWVYRPLSGLVGLGWVQTFGRFLLHNINNLFKSKNTKETFLSHFLFLIVENYNWKIINECLKFKINTHNLTVLRII